MKLARLFLLVLLFIGIPDVLKSQLFDESYPSLGEYRSIGVSGTLQSFRTRSSNPLSDSASIHITSPLWLAEYRQLGLRVALGYSSYKFLNDSRTEFTLAAESTTDISITKNSEGGNVFLPIIFSTNFVQATGASNSAKDFDIADIGVGTGLKYQQVSENFGVQLTGVGILYYSTAGFTIESGSSTAAIVELQFLFRELIGEGMTAGYRFEAESWSMSDKKLNYSRQIHGPFVGIFF